MRVYVGITDSAWYRFLRAEPDLDEVNFWQPSGGRAFGALSAGELFLFKLHYPENMIVGGGTFVRHVVFPLSFVWDAFGRKNGASSYDEMSRRVAHYRRQPLSPGGVERIGCLILADPFFLDETSWIAPPADLARNVVQGKIYASGSDEAERLISEVALRRGGQALADQPENAIEMYGEPSLVRRRRGQGTFQVLVAEAYQRRCAVSGEKALPVLQAAHIKPVSRGGHHYISNGLFLRSDIHTLFDRGYATITPSGEFRASRRLKTDYDNGEPYYALEKTPVRMPADPGDRPSAAALQWHNDEVFRG
jgi:putative restriction endonuclease